MAVTMKVETITPAVAKEYLQKNTDNYRKLSRSKVYQYATEMKAGRWEMNGEGIQFDEAGKLKNGQHRLAAIIQAKVPVKMAVLRGIAEDVSVYDSGANRTVVQISNARGLDVCNTEAAAAKLLASRFSHAVTQGEILDWLDHHGEELHRAYRIIVSSYPKTNGVSKRAPILAAAFLMMQNGMKSYEVECFMRIINTGDSSMASGYDPSPAMTAREMLMKYRGTCGYMQNKEQCEITLLALMDFANGKGRKNVYRITEPLKSAEMMEALYRKERENG